MKYELDLYDKWRGQRIAKGREEGIQQGKEESAIKTAITLLQFGDYSVEKIAECTNLSVETVKKLAK